MQKNPARTIGDLLRGTEQTLSAAESCTGGRISHLITKIPGASGYYLGSVTSYSPEIKKKFLGVSADDIRIHGIVSSRVAECMAEGVRRLTGSTWSVATTGWADAYGDEHEPAGTCWIAVSGPQGTKSVRCRSERSRSGNISAFSTFALETLASYIIETISR